MDGRKQAIREYFLGGGGGSSGVYCCLAVFGVFFETTTES